MRTFKIIYTSDIHGRLFNDPDLPSLETLGKKFKKDGNTLIIDGGDMLQGGSTGEFLAWRNPSPNPFAEIMNGCRYDAMTLGNHDTNFGLEYLGRFLNEFKGICLCANLKDREGRLRIYDTHVFVLENGLRIGVFGITSPYVAYWESPHTASSLIVTSALEAAKRCVESLRERCDVTVCVYHGGFESDRVDTGEENQAIKLCEIPGLDILLTAHQHLCSTANTVGNTLVVQPGSHARTYAEIHGRVTDTAGLTLKTSFLENEACSSVSVHREYRELVRWRIQPLCTLPSSVPARDRVQAALHGSPLADFINDSLLEVSGAQLSMTHLSGGAESLPQRVQIKDVFDNCYNANCLCTILVTGDTLRRVLEWSACAFTVRDGIVCKDDDFLEGIGHLHHFQFIRGLKYSFDFSRSRGERLVYLRCRDTVFPERYRDVLPGDKFTMCLSSYHRYGGDGYAFFKDCPLVSVHTAPIYSYIIRKLRKM